MPIVSTSQIICDQLLADFLISWLLLFLYGLLRNCNKFRFLNTLYFLVFIFSLQALKYWRVLTFKLLLFSSNNNFFYVLLFVKIFKLAFWFLKYWFFKLSLKLLDLVFYFFLFLFFLCLKSLDMNLINFELDSSKLYDIVILDLVVLLSLLNSTLIILQSFWNPS